MRPLLPIFLFLITILLSPKFSIAQTRFIDATITIPDGSIIKGQIEYNDWSTNPGKVNFKSSKNGSIQVFSPTQIKEFSIPSKKEFYKSAVVELNKETIDETKLPEFENIPDAHKYFDSQISKEAVFLLVLVKGKMNLYSFIDVDKGNQIKEHFFIQKGNDSLKYLKNLVAVIKSKDHDNILYKPQEYARQLKYYAGDCANFKINFDSLKYSEPDLIGCVKAYDKCAGNLVFVQQGLKGLTSFYVTGGMNISFSNLNDAFATNLQNTGNATPSIGGGVYFGLGKNGNKFGGIVEAVFQQYKTNSYKEPPTTPGYYAPPRGYVLDVSSLCLSFMIKRTFIADKPTRPYIKAGISGAFDVSANNSLDPRYVKTYAVYNFNLGQPRTSLLFAAGVNFGKFFVEGRYKLESEVPLEGTEAKISANYAGIYVGYTF